MIIFIYIFEYIFIFTKVIIFYLIFYFIQYFEREKKILNILREQQKILNYLIILNLYFFLILQVFL